MLIAVCAALALLAPAALAAKRKRGHPAIPARVTLHPRFTPLRGSHLIAGGGNVLITGRSFPAGAGTLVDGATGTSEAVSRPGCRASAVSAQWIAYTCGSAPALSYELDAIATGQRTPITPSVAFPNQNCAGGCLSIAGVGAQWLAFEAPPATPQSLPVFEFESIANGEGLGDPTDTSIVPDLDSPYLGVLVCSPLSVPTVTETAFAGWGSLLFDHGFAVASGDGGTYLERCGSTLHAFLTSNTASASPCPALVCPPASNARAVIWQAAPGRLGGIFLPSRQPFTIPVPVSVDPLARAHRPLSADRDTLALTATRLYVLTPGGRLWSAPAPLPPRRRRRG